MDGVEGNGGRQCQRCGPQSLPPPPSPGWTATRVWVLLLVTLSAQHAADAGRPRERKACQEPRSGPGRLSQTGLWERLREVCPVCVGRDHHVTAIRKRPPPPGGVGATGTPLRTRGPAGSASHDKRLRRPQEQVGADRLQNGVPCALCLESGSGRLLVAGQASRCCGGDAGPRVPRLPGPRGGGGAQYRTKARHPVASPRTPPPRPHDPGWSPGCPHGPVWKDQRYGEGEWGEGG